MDTSDVKVTYKSDYKDMSIKDILAAKKPAAIGQTAQPNDRELFNTYVQKRKINIHNGNDAIAAFKEFETQKTQFMDFLAFDSYLNSAYKKQAKAIYGDPVAYKSVLAQHQYNQSRQKNGLGTLSFVDPTYDPNTYDEDTNEYLSSFVSKNKRMPTDEDMLDFNKGLKEYQIEKQTKRAYPGQKSAFENDLYNTVWQAQQQEEQAAAAEGRLPNEIDWEDVISKTLAQEKYRDVAKNFKKSVDAEEAEGYSRITAMLGIDKEKNPEVFTDQDLINGYKKITEAMAKKSFRDEEMSLNQNKATNPAKTEQERIKAIDLDATAKRIKQLEGEITGSDKVSANNVFANILRGMSAAQGVKIDEGKIKTSQAKITELAQLKRDYANAQKAQNLIRIEQENPDYKNYTGVPNVQFKDEKNRALFQYINDINGARKVSFDAAMQGGTDPYIAYQYMSDDQKKLYNYLASTKGEKAAAEYADALQVELSAISAEDFNADTERIAEAAPAVSSAMSVLASFRQPEGLLYSAAQTIKGDQIDPNSPYFASTMFKQGIRSTVSSDIKEGIGGFGGDATAFLYNTGLSLLDSVAIAASTGGTGAGASALANGATMAMIGANAATETTRDAKLRGATNEQALIAGGLAGIAEAVFEKIGLDNLFKIANKAGKASVVKSVLRQMFVVEGGEEALTEIANIITDTAVMGDISNYNTAVQSYMNQGMNEGQAKIKAIGDMAANVGLAYAGGVLMGGMGGSVAGTVGNIPSYQASKQTSRQADISTKINNFETAVQSIGLDETSAQGVIAAYAEAVQTDTQPAKLQNTVKRAASQKAEIESDLNVAQTEILANLQVSYDAIQRAETPQAKEAARAKYMRDFTVAQAKNKAAKLKASNRNTEVNDMVIEAAESLREMTNTAIMQAKKAKEGAQNGRGQQGQQEPGQPVQGNTQLRSETGTGTVLAGDRGNTPESPSIAQDRGRGEGNPRANAEGQYIQRDGAIDTGDASGASNRNDAQAIRGNDGSGRSLVERGLKPTPQAEQSIENRARFIEKETGYKPIIRIVNKVTQGTAKILDDIKDVTARDVFLYESDDNYGDGWADESGIYVRVNGKSDIAFVNGHEIAHSDRNITAAGMAVVKTLSNEQLNRYKEYRDQNISSLDSADIKRELVADMYGKYVSDTSSQGTVVKETFGLDRSTVDQFFRAFYEAESAENLDDVSQVTSANKETSDEPEYSRVLFEKDKIEYTYVMPAIKQRKDGTYHAVFMLDGKRTRLENSDKEALEGQIRRIKEGNAYKNSSQVIRNRRESQELFQNKTTLPEYMAKENANYEVAKHLRRTYLKNGIAQGGALAEEELKKVNENVNQWADHAPIWHTVSSPQRIFEELANWRPKDKPASRAHNYLEGETLKNTYWGFVKDQGGNLNLWLQEEAQKVLSAFDGNNRTSTLAQMLGEDIITEQEAAEALYDNQNMVVTHKKRKFVFDKQGQITAMASGGELVIFDKGYRDRMNKARADIAKLAANRDPKISQETHLKEIREAQQNAMKSNKPIITEGDIVIKRNGNNVRAEANGKVLADIRDGKSPNMESVTKLKDALKDFYKRILPMQNGTLTENGFRPIQPRKDYFPHMGRDSHGIQNFIDTLRGEAEALPTEISGLSATFAPGKPWVNHMLERMGSQTEYDAIKGFNKYLRSSGDLIFYTPAIQRIRQLEKYVREESIGNKNSALASWLHNYGNMLANKKPDLDRSLEDMTGRAVYTVSDKLTRAFGAASVAGSLSSSLSNLIGFVSSVPGLEQKRIVPAILDTLRNGEGRLHGERDSFIENIPVLARRYRGYEDILETKYDKAKRTGSKALGVMFEALDRFSVETVARAKYAEFKGKGLSDAVQRTDDFIVKMFAERSKGMTPALFGVKSFKPVFQFQLEALNQLSHFRDLDRQDIAEQVDAIIAKNKGVVDGIDWAQTENRLKAITPKGIWRKLYYLMLLSMWGAFTRAVLGRDQTWNPVGIATDIATANKPMEEVWQTLVDQAPLLSTFTGGRIPLMGGIENVKEAAGKFTDPNSTLKDISMALLRAGLSFVPGGAQASKTIRGLEAFNKGGNYTDSGKLRYPIDQTPGRFLQTAAFGPYAAAPKEYDYKKDTLSNSKTEKYKELIDKGFEQKTAYDFLKTMDKSGTKAGTLVSMATFDGNKDNKPDFGANEIAKLVAALELKKIPQNVDIAKLAQKEAEKYIKEKRKDKELEPEKLKDAEALYKSWLKLLEKRR